MAQDTLEKQPTADVSVNKPSSGTYGERVDRERLAQSLPPMGGPGQAPPGPAPMPGSAPSPLGGVGGRPKQAPPGVPGALLTPSDRPGVPLTTPLREPGPPASAMAGAGTAAQARLALLQGLAEAPDVSETTREWARMLLEALTVGD